MNMGLRRTDRGEQLLETLIFKIRLLTLQMIGDANRISWPSAFQVSRSGVGGLRHEAALCSRSGVGGVPLRTARQDVCRKRLLSIPQPDQV